MSGREKAARRLESIGQWAAAADVRRGWAVPQHIAAIWPDIASLLDLEYLDYH